jgi:hypothetical protein
LASIFNNIVFSFDIIFTCFGSDNFNAHSQKISHSFKIANCLDSVFSIVVYFCTDKLQDLITYRLLSISHSSNNTPDFLRVIDSKYGLFSKNFISNILIYY